MKSKTELRQNTQHIHVRVASTVWCSCVYCEGIKCIFHSGLFLKDVKVTILVKIKLNFLILHVCFHVGHCCCFISLGASITAVMYISMFFPK